MLYKTPHILEFIYPSLTWKRDTTDKVAYLTFDDGPIPEVTPWVLDVLDEYGVKATFFCIGDNARKYPELVQEIIKRGHQIGNHTHNHLNGWHTSLPDYLANIQEAESFLPKSNSKALFRPPYGRIKRSQLKALKKHYEIIMWSVLTHDYNQALNVEECYNNSIKAVEPGAIIIFHDSIKAEKNLKAVLPNFIKTLLSFNYKLINL